MLDIISNINLKKSSNNLSNDKSKFNIKNKEDIDYAKVFKNVDDFLDLGKNKNFNPSELNDAEKEKYVIVIAKLMKKGIIGYHYYEKNGKIRKRFIETEIGDRSIDKRDRIINSHLTKDLLPYREEIRQNGVQINYELNLEFQESINIIL